MAKKIILLLLWLLPLISQAGGFSQQGKATYYAASFIGKKTTSGEPYDPEKLTAAHASLPLHCYVKVLNLKNGRSVVVRINDRMSRKSRFVLDVSKAAARQLKIVEAGMGPVKITRISKQAALALQRKAKTS